MEDNKIPEDDKDSKAVQESKQDDVKEPAEEPSEEERKGPKGLFRWKGVIALIVVFAIVAVINIFFIDEIMRSGIIRAGNFLTGTRTEVGPVEISMSALTVDAEGFSLVDPDDISKNAVQAGKVEFSIETRPLLQRKIVVRNIAVNGVAWDVDRPQEAIEKDLEDRQQTPEPKEPEADKQGKGPAILPDLSEIKKRFSEKVIISEDDLQTPASVERLQQNISQFFEKHTKNIDGINAESRIQHAEKVLKTCSYMKDVTKKDLSDPEKAKKINSDLKKLDKAVKNVEQLQQQVQNEKELLSEDMKSLEEQYQTLQQKSDADMTMIRNKYSSESFSFVKITEILFGKKASGFLQKYGPVFKKASKLFPGKKDKKAKKRIPGGRTVDFGRKGTAPSLLLRRISFSGQKSGTEISGEITNICSDPRQLDKPAKVQLTCTRPRFVLDAVIDRTRENRFDRYNLSMKDMSPGRFLPEKSSLFPFDITKGTGELTVDLTITKQDITVTADLVLHDILLTGEAGGIVGQILKETFHSALDHAFNIRYSAQKGLVVTSDFNKKFNNIAKRELNNVIRKKQANAEKMAREIIDRKKQEVRNKLQTEKNLVTNINTLKKDVDNLQNRLTTLKKEFEQQKKQLENEMKQDLDREKDKLEEEAKDALEGLFK